MFLLCAYIHVTSLVGKKSVFSVAEMFDDIKEGDKYDDNVGMQYGARYHSGWNWSKTGMLLVLKGIKSHGFGPMHRIISALLKHNHLQLQ